MSVGRFRVKHSKKRRVKLWKNVRSLMCRSIHRLEYKIIIQVYLMNSWVKYQRVKSSTIMINFFFLWWSTKKHWKFCLSSTRMINIKMRRMWAIHLHKIYQTTRGNFEYVHFGWWEAMIKFNLSHLDSSTESTVLCVLNVQKITLTFENLLCYIQNRKKSDLIRNCVMAVSSKEKISLDNLD